MRRSSLWDLWAPVLTVCVLLPGLAGMWWRYHFDYSDGGRPVSAPVFTQPKVPGMTNRAVDAANEFWHFLAQGGGPISSAKTACESSSR